MKKYQYLLLAAIAVGLASCEPEFDKEVSNESYSAGEANFSTYVAVGNSLTSGYMDECIVQGNNILFRIYCLNNSP